MRESQEKLELLTKNQMSAAMGECCAEPGDVISVLRGPTSQQGKQKGTKLVTVIEPQGPCSEM